MSITDELRKFTPVINGYKLMRPCDEKELLAIADRIDAEHEKAMNRAGQLLADAESDRDYNYANWQDCKQKVLQHNITIDELNARIECLEDELSRRIKLLVDADGEVIHIGDVMAGEIIGGGLGEPFEVIGYIMSDGELEPMDKNKNPRKRKYLHHHHEPTVEDVLHELVGKALNVIEIGGEDKLVAEYAAKLRLAGDGE